MSGHRIGRITDDIKREITAILREVKDPRIIHHLISVVRVDVTNDLSFAKVYISSIDSLDQTNEAVKGLKSAAGFIRRELAHRLKIRHVPELIFVATDSIEYGANISKMLNDLNK